MAFSFDMLLEIQVPRPWTEGKEHRRFHEALEQAVLAEEMGFDTLWAVEHHFLTEFAHSSAPEALLGALSQRTSRVRLGHGVALLPGAVNHPIRVAERAATLDILSNGRLEMGTGRSSSPYQLEAFGADVATTREQWEEAIKLLPKLWTEDAITNQGRFFSWDDPITVIPRPVQQPHPPLWVASTQADTCRLAGEKGIGLLMPAVNAPAALRPQVEAYKTAIANPIDQVGHFVNDQCAMFALTFLHDDEDKARVMGGSGAMWYVQTISEIYANDWRGTPIEKVPESYRAHAESRRQGQASGGTVTAGAGTFATVTEAVADRQVLIDQFIDSGAFNVGTPARVVENVKQYIEVGADRMVVLMHMADLPHDDIMRSIELFGTKVIPEIRAYEAERELVAGSAGGA